MKPCTRLGLDVTSACNLRCIFCFYRFEPSFREPTWSELQTQIDTGIRGGLDHMVAIGYGEPSLAPLMSDVLDYCHERGIATSMISNGATGLDRFKEFFRAGMDHVHLSSHALGDTLDELVGKPGVFAAQAELKEWLASECLPFRTNATLQQLNYKQLPDLAEYEIEHKVHHFVFLGWLPHYRLANHVREIAVHPAELRPYIEDAADRLLDAGTLFTIRYQPLCHLAPKYWPYVVNARYVFFDNTEWNYTLQAHDVEALWEASKVCGESAAIQGEPCNQCAARRHCGAWNRTYAEAFGGADLQPIYVCEVPEPYREVWDQDGGLHDLNPATRIPSRIRTGQVVV